VGRRDGPAQPGVPVRAAGQQQQVPADGVGLAVLGAGQFEGQLSAEHGGQLELPGRLAEPHHPVQAVMIGDGQRRETELGGLLGEFLRMAGTVEEAEVGVAVQFGVRDGVVRPRKRGRPVLGPSAAPGRRVAPVGLDGDRVHDERRVGHAGAPPVGPLARLARHQPREPPVQLVPRDVRVVEPHQRPPTRMARRRLD
jgi:hypothetical protein